MIKRVRRHAAMLPVVLAAGALVGCGQSGPGTGSGNGAAPHGVALRTVDRRAYDALVAGHRGQVVLVDFWATWCVPCVEQFPHTVEMARRYRDRGLAVVSVSMDDPGERETILAFLDSHDAGVVENLISQYGSGPRSMEVFQVQGGALPHYKLYDRRGQLRRTFAVDPASEKAFTVADVEAAVRELLGE